MEGHGPAAALGRVFASESRTFEVCALVFRWTPARGRPQVLRDPSAD